MTYQNKRNHLASGNIPEHLHPGELFRYCLVVLSFVFGLLFVISLFFPNFIPHPNIGLLNELVDVIHNIFGHAGNIVKQ